MNYFLKIYGCQHNEWDGTRIDYILQKLGLNPASEKDADLIFVLSCSVRQTAIDRLLGKLRVWKGKKVIIAGCVLEMDRKKLEERGAFIWDSNKPEELINILSCCHSGLDPESNEILKQVQDDNLNMIALESNTSSAYLPIMTGCNNFCSYCAVPYTRGRESSRPVDDIVNDFKRMVAKGHKEIMLLGQNVNSYSPKSIVDSRQSGRISSFDNTKKTPFAQLLQTLNDLPEDFVIAFTSNHPKDMTDDVIKAIATLAKVQKRIHLPVQSGSNKILKAMNRPYTREKYLELVKKIKENIPDIEITTDSIIGFPGETEEDFEETVDLYKKVEYFQAFNNKYSPRDGTAAFKLGDPISWAEKQRRWRILNDLVYKKS